MWGREIMVECSVCTSNIKHLQGSREGILGTSGDRASGKEKERRTYEKIEEKGKEFEEINDTTG